eukprot:CAMPEP_0170552422 /NCGR_PEP_ID=MMETSP0211-20121228/10315_1 /TAXON_ID=311385 /ORGANISM="Pseudokeronopsis sp., Strain OXSARD2" /LENGTH=101 /DNA_ID=CAMNT_0010860133 /DNA_START=112 /DNA_END=414 /DNA_ORIENTATION=+
MRRLLLKSTVDGNQVLKQELVDSSNRVNAAKKGYKLAEISPLHNLSFFFPEKKKYLKLQSNSVNRGSLQNSKALLATPVPDDSYTDLKKSNIVFSKISEYQ